MGSFEVDLQRMVQRPQRSGGVERKVRRMAQATTPNVGEQGRDVATPSRSEAPMSSHSRRNTTSAIPSVTPTPPRRTQSVSSRAAPRSPSVAQAVGARATPPSSSLATPTGHAVPSIDDDEALAIALAFAEEDLGGALPGVLAGAGAGIVGQNSRSNRQTRSSSARGSRTPASRQRASRPAPDSDEALAILLAQQEELAFGGYAGQDLMALALSMDTNNAGFGNVDVDRMTYEELLQLGDRIGYADRSKPTVSQLSRLPTRILDAAEVARLQEEQDNECPVCCEEYEPGTEIRTLQCLHGFHTSCIDKWLTSNAPGARSCPVCHSAIEI